MENFTLEQVKRYYHLISKKVMVDVKVDSIAVMYSCAYAFGTVKKDAFMKFLENLDPKIKKTVTDSIEKMKDMGLPIEEQ